MKFVVDEDVAIEVVRFLRNAGHQVEEVFHVLGPATLDPAIWQHAVQTGAIVITCNRDDFLNLVGERPAWPLTSTLLSRQAPKAAMGKRKKVLACGNRRPTD